MLWYLHLCSVNNIIVTDYLDNANAVMEETKDGKGKFTEVTLHPNVKITDPSRINEANKLHQKANRMCFIANSCNFPIKHTPITTKE